MIALKLCFGYGCRMLAVLLAPVMFAPQTSHAQEAVSELNCADCHTCAVPTAHRPCLTSCPRDQMVNQVGRHELGEAQDSIVLDVLSALYGPVIFNHKQHAAMAEMGDSCATCHHYSPVGHIPPCRDCHDPETRSTDLTKPNLKGAYHRQCLSCHREWSHNSDCDICHTPLTGGILSTHEPDPTDIIGHSHPDITVPITTVYYTAYEEGPIVTFQHKEHIDLFGFQCVDCHRRESCGNCHDIQKRHAVSPSAAEPHAACNDCHIDDNCTKCHDTEQRPGFSHNSTGWPLGNYHQQLDCWTCHPAGRRIGRISRMCVTCHADWNQENFRHAITGLDLDETHAQLDCTDCHVDQQYDREPDCSDCHDDGRTAESAPPGIRGHPGHPKL